MSARVAPPPLEFPYPGCSVCGCTCTLDGETWSCPDCGITWPMAGAHLYEGEWTKPDAATCLRALAPWRDSSVYPDLADTVYGCVLHEGHQGLCQNPQWLGGFAPTDPGVYERTREAGESA